MQSVIVLFFKMFFNAYKNFLTAHLCYLHDFYKTLESPFATVQNIDQFHYLKGHEEIRISSITENLTFYFFKLIFTINDSIKRVYRLKGLKSCTLARYSY